MQVREYETGTEVVRFRANDLETYGDDIEVTANALRTPGSLMGITAEETIAYPVNVTIKAGEAINVLALEDGPGALAELTLQESQFPLQERLFL